MIITCTKHKPSNTNTREPAVHDTHTVRCEGIIHLDPCHTHPYDGRLGGRVVLQVGETRHGDEDTRR